MFVHFCTTFKNTLQITFSIMNLKEEALKLHRLNKGKLETKSKVRVATKEDLSLVYTPGVAEVCR